MKPIPPQPNSPPAPKPRDAARILIIEDETPLRIALMDRLAAEGYRVLIAADGEAGLERALTEKPDLILLDLMLPKLDGLAVCQKLRELGQRVPILMLTGKGTLQDRVQGLDLGADDYLVKPFLPAELLARIRALLRRDERATRSVTELVLGEVRVDFARQQAWRGRRPLHLVPKEFAMLRLLAEAEGRTLTREQFLDAVWGVAAYPTTRTVDTHMATLRAKIEPEPDRPRWLLTVYGVGYRLETKG